MATFFGKLLEGVGNFFKNLVDELFNSAEKAFKALPEATQQQIIDGSGIMSLVGQMVDDTPQDVINALNKTFPKLSNDTLVKGFELLISAWNLTPLTNTLDGLIESVQKHLKSKEGTVWESLMNEAASLFGSYLSGDTIFQVIVMLMQWVYEKYVQGKIKKPATD